MSRSDISATPCGHVFHTKCIEEWLQSGQKKCLQCRKACRRNEIIKLYFSEADPENNLIAELMEENLKLQTEANESKSENMRLQTDANKSQSEILKLQTEANEAKSQLLKANQKYLQIQEEKLKLSKHGSCQDWNHKTVPSCKVVCSSTRIKDAGIANRHSRGYTFFYTAGSGNGLEGVVGDGTCWLTARKPV